MLRNLLIYRVLVLNLLVVAGIVWGFANGHIQMLFAAEKTGIGYAMVAVFLVVMVGFAQRVYKTSVGLNAIKEGKKIDVKKFRIKSSFVSAAAVWLVTLGLIGNIIGFALAVQGLDLSGGPDTALQAINQMIDGMKIAFYATLIGTALGLWLAVNAHILNTANALLSIDAGQ